ncbi:MAG: hypothetical protein [Bacteriophage sp.]|nr:MAG: hypothetical protein [Bacteriophage sp.]
MINPRELFMEFDIINYDEVKGLVIFMTSYIIFYEVIFPRYKRYLGRFLTWYYDRYKDRL